MDRRDADGGASGGAGMGMGMGMGRPSSKRLPGELFLSFSSIVSAPGYSYQEDAVLR